MPTLSPLRLSLVLVALLSAGTAQAESRRAAQSLPQPVRPQPARFIEPPHVPAAPAARLRAGEHDGAGGGQHGGGFDEHRYGGHGGRHEIEDAQEHESHHIGHHEHDDSPGA